MWRQFIVTKAKRQFIVTRTLLQRGFNIMFTGRALVFTNSVTSGGCMFIGDFMQQIIERHYEDKHKSKTNQYDWPRFERMFIVGAVLGTLHHYYYLSLDKLLHDVTLRNVMLKILADQVVCAPLTLLLFFYGMSYLQGRTFERATQEIKEKIIVVYAGDLVFWPPVQFINFSYVPTRYRVVYINAATIIYNVFLSFMKHDYDE